MQLRRLRVERPRPAELRLPIRQLAPAVAVLARASTPILGAVDGVILQERVPDIVAARARAGPPLRVLKVARRDHRDRWSSRPSARSATTRSPAGGAASRTSSSARSLDVVFLIGIATSQHVPGRRGVRRPAPVQLELRAGPVPGLHPRSRPGAAGRDRERARRRHAVLGVVAGSADRVARPSRSGGLHDRRPSSLGVVELVTMLGAVLRVREGRAPSDREGRSWRPIAARGVGHGHPPGAQLRLARGVAAAVPHWRCALIYQPRRPLPRALAGADRQRERAIWIPIIGVIVGFAIVITAIPAARLSDRSGARPSSTSACAIGAAGHGRSLTIAPTVSVAAIGIASSSPSAPAASWPSTGR